MILPEAEAIEKVCGISMATQHTPRKCLGSMCVMWVWLERRENIDPAKRKGSCGLIIETAQFP